MAAIGIGLVLLLLAGIADGVAERDWHSLAQVLLFAGCLVLSLVLLSVTARLLVRVFAPRHIAKRTVSTQDPRVLENPDYGVLSDTGERLRMETKNGNVEVPWKEIEEVHAYKRDLLTTDLICLAFKKQETNECLEITEEMAGYHDLLQALPNRLPGFTLNWFPDVAFPAFKANHRTIWKRSQSRHD